MRHPLDALPIGQRRRVFLPLLGLTLLLMFVLQRIDVPLRTPASPHGIVSYEVAGDQASARRMIDTWGEVGRRYAAFSLGIDYLFMVAYSTTIAFGCLWAARVLGGLSPALAAAGAPLAWGSWLAALGDAGENAALTIMLLGTVRSPWPAVAWWCAVPKFVLLAAALLYVLVGALVRMVRGAAS
jgi:hypothetical protein